MIHNKKAQVLNLVYIAGFLLFVIVVIYTAGQVNGSVSPKISEIDSSILKSKAHAIGTLLSKTTGEPENWSVSNVNILGLSRPDYTGLSLDKINQMYNISYKKINVGGTEKYLLNNGSLLDGPYDLTLNYLLSLRDFDCNIKLTNMSSNQVIKEYGVALPNESYSGQGKSVRFSSIDNDTIRMVVSVWK